MKTYMSERKVELASAYRLFSQSRKRQPQDATDFNLLTRPRRKPLCGFGNKVSEPLRAQHLEYGLRVTRLVKTSTSERGIIV